MELSRRPYRPGADSWRFDIERVGNWILEEPIHFFDLARWYLDTAGTPQTIYARANSRQTGHPELQAPGAALRPRPGGASDRRPERPLRLAEADPRDQLATALPWRHRVEQ